MVESNSTSFNTLNELHLQHTGSKPSFFFCTTFYDLLFYQAITYSLNVSLFCLLLIFTFLWNPATLYLSAFVGLGKMFHQHLLLGFVVGSSVSLQNIYSLWLNVFNQKMYNITKPEKVLCPQNQVSSFTCPLYFIAPG